MRRITLPDITFRVMMPGADGSEPQLEEISAARQLQRLVIFAPSERGFTIDDIRKRVPLSEKLEKAKRVLVLEDGEYDILLDALKTASWAVVSQSVIELGDAIESAEALNLDAEGQPKPPRAARRRKAREG